MENFLIISWPIVYEEGGSVFLICSKNQQHKDLFIIFILRGWLIDFCSYTIRLLIESEMEQRHRRKPLILSSTVVLKSHLPDSKNLQDVSHQTVQFKVGILEEVDTILAVKNCPKIASSLDTSALVGLSISALKRLAITSDSLVCLF